MKTAICYFSGTGNGFDIALSLEKHIEGSNVFYIPFTDIELLVNYSRLIIVSPIYSFGVPIIIKQFIDRIKLYKNKIYYGVLHYGGFKGNARYYFKKLFDKSELVVNDIYTLKMPENFTIDFVPPEKYIMKQLESSKKTIGEIAERIKRNETNTINKNIFFFCDRIHENNALKWPTMAYEHFNVTDKCNKCQICIKICPVKNIQIENEEIVFKQNCIACLACYHRCPTCAINYDSKTYDKKRYINPNVKINEMR
ncbi:MAG: EFR1 family ferrodoxin [Spirochaetaceae bacterium]|nr:EFR1 family ferrodoxin [Spirochaetaceae bacterium]